MSDHNPLDLIALAGKDARIAELNGCIAELEDECHTWADRMAASETANLNRIAELETLLQRVLHHGPIVPIQLAADIMAAGITRPARSTEPRP